MGKEETSRVTEMFRIYASLCDQEFRGNSDGTFLRTDWLCKRFFKFRLKIVLP